MRFLQGLFAIAALVSGVSSFVYPVKRTVPSSSVNVQLQDFTLSGGVLSGHIYIKNIAYQKVVTVYYSSASDVWPSDASTQSISASYSESISGTSFETWTFSGTIGSAGIRHFYICYDVSGSSYYDNNGTKNYDVGTTTATASSTTTSSTSTTTTKVISTTTASSTSTSTTSATSTTVSTTSTTGSGSTGASISINPSTSTTGSSPTTYPNPDTIPADLPACQVFTGDACSSGTQTDYTVDNDQRKWQTPPKGASDWQSGFQDYRELTGYADYLYASDRKSAKVIIVAFSRQILALQYSFDGGNTFQGSNSATITSSFTGGLNVVVQDSNGHILTLDPLFFAWDAPTINRPETQSGQKVSIVELFGWPYADIEKECTFLSKAGWGGVRIWPPSEAVFSDYWAQSGEVNPWWFVYQPVSYRLISRQGSIAQLRSMIQSCRAAGVRIYADTVVNHMTGGGNDNLNHRGSSSGTCGPYGAKNSTAGSPYFTHSNTYQYSPQTGLHPALEYPAVPYGPTDFHCDRSLNSFTDPFQLQYGWLVGLADLNTEHANVQERIATYFATLLSIGFSGFRIDAAKHMGPTPVSQILARFKTKMGGSFPDDFITWLEVILGGEKDLLACQPNYYNWYSSFNDLMTTAGLTASEIAKVKIWSSDYPKEFPICGSWILPPSRFVIQNDDHDQQSPGSSSRDMQDSGSVLIKDKDVVKHRTFEVELFTRKDFPDAGPLVRNVLSSYSFMDSGAAGFPDGYSSCSQFTGTGNCITMEYTPAYDADACGYSVVQNGAWQQGKYTRVHRDLSIVNAMRSWYGLVSITATAAGLPSTCI